MKSEKLTMAILALCSFVFLPIFAALAEDNDPHETGLPELTPAELKTIQTTQPRVEKVRLNDLGLSRVNAYRKHKGLPLLSNQAAVEDGKELVTVVGGILGAKPVADSAVEALPLTVDNSQLKYFPPIDTQGGLPSCGVFSGTYYAMTYMWAKANDYDAQNGGDAFRLSPKWTYNMVNGGENTGSWYYWAYDVGLKHGVATWGEFPYGWGSQSDYREWCLDPAVWQASIYRRFDYYGYVGNTDRDSGMALVKQILVDGYVLNFPTYIYSWQWTTISNDPGTEEDNAFAGKNVCYWVNGTGGYHAMTVVGYNDNIWVDINSNGVVDSGEKGAFRIANSWGMGWGEAGFCWMAYDALKARSAVRGGPRAGRIRAWSPPMAHWVVARSGYTPVLLAKFTVNHLKRDQLGITLGLSETSESAPSTIWTPNAIYYQGGPYAFDGTTVALDGTFVFDFSDLAPATAEMKRFYLGMADSTAMDSAILTDFRLIDLVGNFEAEAMDVPQTADAGQVYSSVDYTFDNRNIAPVATFTAIPTAGIVPLTVSFDGRQSYDSDGSISSYEWDFGDGVSDLGITVTHTYRQAGTFNATLTVVDNLGASGSDSVEISVSPDPNVIIAASDLTAGVLGRDVTLTWSDNSSNEDGFYIERAVKANNPSYAQVGQVGADVESYPETVDTGTYYYRVQAYNNLTVSDYSNTATARVRR